MGHARPPYPFGTRDPRAFIQVGDMTPAETEAYQLFLLAEAGVEQVRLRAGSSEDTAPECHETHGFAMTVDEAMHLQPIPHEGERGVALHLHVPPRTVRLPSGRSGVAWAHSP